MWLYPEILDFTKSDSLYINYAAEGGSMINGLSLNEDKEDLSCEKIPDKVVRCTVPKNHFEGKKTGYYFIKHTNHKNTKSTSFEISPLKIILSDPKPSKGSIQSISLLYYSLLLILIIF